MEKELPFGDSEDLKIGHEPITGPCFVFFPCDSFPSDCVSSLLPQLHSNSDKGDGSVRYILSGEGAGTIFIIDEVTGDIHAAKSLDRERKSHYVLHAQALDRYTEEALEPKSEFIIKVQDINDNAPKFPEGPFVVSVPEMSEVGTSVIQITATDADDPTYGNSARIVYSILQGQPYFSVDPKTGIIRTALNNMDREAREHYAVVIQAKDMAGQVGGLSGSTTINITLSDVNDNPPKFPQKNYHQYVPESAQVGKPVAKIKANDEDLGVNAEIKYTIINSEGANTFSIATDRDSREGVVSLKKPLNYERKKTYTLHIEGTNTHTDPRFTYLGSFKDTATLKFTVGDVDEPPVFSMEYYIMDVYENAPPGTEVGAVIARDPDSRNSPVRYFMGTNEDEEEEGEGEEGVRYFTIDADSGVIRTTGPLDREAQPWHNITVMASEVDNPSLLSQVAVTTQVLDVNDNAPEVATDEEVIVCESSRPGQEWGAIVVLFITLRRSKKEPLIFSEEDVRENVVTYDDEGGGEEDTEAFDIAALRNPAGAEELKFRRDVRPESRQRHRRRHRRHRPPPREGGAARGGGLSREEEEEEEEREEREREEQRLDAADVHEFIKQKLVEADLDASVPPYDSLQTYAYEGGGSPAGSISSLDSPAGARSGEGECHLLDDWGPAFQALAGLCGEARAEAVAAAAAAVAYSVFLGSV
ncbi:cadherin-18-like [Gadus chalcogrammus]|uniref:cadherin-18-like n=1 Tax=Gadus chalcogrammus TaxID=1042646 RepID=UPI0024C4E079|nr:cadherin-18-like [Gadus chalcogrammus]